jgi:hypothetical protein
MHHHHNYVRREKTSKQETTIQFNHVLKNIVTLNLNASWNTSSSTSIKLDQLLSRQQQVLEQNKNEKDMNN